MAKTFSKIIITILFFIIGFVGYFSLIGFETKSFNKQIKENLKKIDTNLDVKLNDVKIILDLLSLTINAKTIGPSISYNNKLLNIELIKSDISLSNLFNREFSLSNLFISTKSVKLKDIVAFIRAVKNENRSELFILENFIDNGYLVADLNLNFDEQGKIEDNFKINGLVKDGSINLLGKKKINKIDFIFEIQNNNADISDLKFSYEKINFTSNKIRFINESQFTNIEGKINNDKINLSEERLKNIIDPFLKLNLNSLEFFSENKFFIQINEKFEILDYEIKSLLKINELSIKNNFNVKNILPDLKSEIKGQNHEIETIYKKDNLSINGSGDFLVQKNYNKINYKIKKIKDDYSFDLQFDSINDPIILDFLNYKTKDRSNSTIQLKGKYLSNRSLHLQKIKFQNDTDLININGLVLSNDFKILDIQSANFSFTDVQNKMNIFQIKNKKRNFLISGKKFNASKLIQDLIFEESENKDFFDNDYTFKIDLKEVYLHKEYITYDLKGNLSLKNNNVVKANISSKFSENEKMSFTIIKNGDQKVTTFFSDQAKPFVEKFNFIKGFEKGSLDFYSVRSKNITNSKLKIYDFKLKELPALTKILTLASLQGIADMLSGEGIGFSEFEMNFQNKDKLMTINEIYAIGPAISILMEGYIEKNKLVSLRGTLVPATTINKVIGSIPIIGDILVGKKTGEGVFGVSYKIKGPPKKLETTVNPIKTLTPRFITRTLEKIKKN